MATRRANLSLAAAVGDGLTVLRRAGFDLVFLETAGIGQSDSEIVDQVDCSLYVMTPDYGAPSQLEKIDMIDFADSIVLNKCDRRGAADSLRDVRKQWRRNRNAFDRGRRGSGLSDGGSQLERPGYREPCTGARGVARTWRDGLSGPRRSGAGDRDSRTRRTVPGARERYLAEIADIDPRLSRTSKLGRSRRPGRRICAGARDSGRGPASRWRRCGSRRMTRTRTRAARRDTRGGRGGRSGLASQLGDGPRSRAMRRRSRPTRCGTSDRGREPRRDAFGHAASEGCASAQRRLGRAGAISRAGESAGHFPLHGRRLSLQATEEDPTRMFAGEGGPERTNRRFHYLSSGQPAARLSTAFDSVTLYGRDPAEPRTSSGRSATRASRSAPWTTPRSSTRASICARPRPRSR